MTQFNYPLLVDGWIELENKDFSELFTRGYTFNEFEVNQQEPSFHISYDVSIEDDFYLLEDDPKHDLEYLLCNSYFVRYDPLEKRVELLNALPLNKFLLTQTDKLSLVPEIKLNNLQRRDSGLVITDLAWKTLQNSNKFMGRLYIGGYCQEPACCQELAWIENDICLFQINEISDTRIWFFPFKIKRQKNGNLRKQ